MPCCPCWPRSNRVTAPKKKKSCLSLDSLRSKRRPMSMRDAIAYHRSLDLSDDEREIDDLNLHITDGPQLMLSKATSSEDDSMEFYETIDYLYAARISGHPLPSDDQSRNTAMFPSLKTMRAVNKLMHMNRDRPGLTIPKVKDKDESQSEGPSARRPPCPPPVAKSPDSVHVAKSASVEDVDMVRSLSSQSKATSKSKPQDVTVASSDSTNIPTTSSTSFDSIGSGTSLHEHHSIELLNVGGPHGSVGIFSVTSNDFDDIPRRERRATVGSLPATLPPLTSRSSLTASQFHQFHYD